MDRDRLLSKYLGIYLNDHLAGATAGLALARRSQGNNRDTPLGDFLAQLASEIDADRETLRAVMRRLDVREDRVKKLAALATERAGRLKLNGELLKHSPLSRVVELEGLYLGVTGKRALWRVLNDLDDPRLAEFDFPALLERTERQRSGLEEARRRSARETFGARTKR